MTSYATETERVAVKAALKEGLAALPPTDWRLIAFDAQAGDYLDVPMWLSPPRRQSVRAELREMSERMRANGEPMEVNFVPTQKISVLSYVRVSDIFGVGEMDVHFNVYHELGHFAMETEEKFPGRNDSEVAADIFAMLMHFKRYGTEGEDDTALVQYARMSRFLYGDVEHYTSPALGALYEVRNTLDFGNMTTRQMLDMARAFARVNALPPGEVASLSDIFDDVIARSAEACKTNAFAYLDTLADTLTGEAREAPGAARLRKVFSNIASLNIDHAETERHAAIWSGLRDKVTSASPSPSLPSPHP